MGQLFEEHRGKMLFLYRAAILILLLILSQKVDRAYNAAKDASANASLAVEKAEEAAKSAEAARSAAIGADIGAAKAKEAAENAKREVLFQNLRSR